MQLNSVGLAGEFRCVVTKTDGTIKEDTGYQKNLILNQGLNFFGGNQGSSFNLICAVGSGNSTPAITQTGLDAFIALVAGSETTYDVSYVDTGDNLYRMWEQKKYRFTGLNNVNISEVGLCSAGSSSTSYNLTTRALIKDSEGNPTTITVKSDETLDIYYKIYKVVDVSDKSFVVNILDGNGGAVPYNAVIRPIAVGKDGWRMVSNAISTAGEIHTGTDDLSAITTKPSAYSGGRSILSGYTTDSLKRTLTLEFNLSEGNRAIRTVTFDDYFIRTFSFFPFQMRLGRVSDDAPLTKNNQETLTVPFEISWGRYEGEL